MPAEHSCTNPITFCKTLEYMPGLHRIQVLTPLKKATQPWAPCRLLARRCTLLITLKMTYFLRSCYKTWPWTGIIETFRKVHNSFKKNANLLEGKPGCLDGFAGKSWTISRGLQWKQIPQRKRQVSENKGDAIYKRTFRPKLMQSNEHHEQCWTAV